MFLALISFDSYQLIADVIKYCNKTLGRKEALEYMKSETKHGKPSKWKKCCLVRVCSAVWSKLKRYLTGSDTIFWFLNSILKEVFEIFIQTQAMIIYNGGTDHSELAQKPYYIQMFSTVLLINCILCSIMWFLYAFKADFCYGVVFEIILNSSDAVCDIFYAMFPLIIAFGYDNPSILTSLASLETGNGLSANRIFYETETSHTRSYANRIMFIATLVPICCCC